MNKDIKVALVKYITGQADETEAAEIRQWINRSPENEELFFQLYEAWHQSLASETKLDTEAAFEDFKVRVISEKVVVKKLNRYLKYAAMLALLPLAGTLVYRYQRNRQEVPALITMMVPSGLPKKLVLPDGTEVWLNAGSELKYSPEFGKKDRTVFLTGEAYFDIAKVNTNIPFLVKTEKYTIRDIGTVFNVKAYPDDRIFEAAVMEGQISVEGPLTDFSAEDSKVLLDANHVLKIAKTLTAESKEPAASNEPVKVLQIDPHQTAEFNGWKDDELVFQEETFDEIASILERRYNVEISFSAEHLKNYKYTGTFRQQPNVVRVLDVIKETTEIHYAINNNKIIISER